MNRRLRRGFTLIELLVVVAVIGILASMLAPTLLRTMRQASLVKCQSNLHQLGIANAAYANNWGDYYPCYGKYYEWDDALCPHELIRPFAEPAEIHLCPIDPSPQNCWWWTLHHPTLNASSYMWNEHIMTWGYTGKRMSFKNPSTIGLISDGWGIPNCWVWTTAMMPEQLPTPCGSRIDWHHEGGVNMLFADLRTEKVKHVDLDKVRSNPF